MSTSSYETKNGEDRAFVLVDDQMVDITAPEQVQIQIRNDGKVVWVNVDGICRLRCCQVGEMEILDERDMQSG